MDIVIMLGAMGTHIAAGDPAGMSHEVVPLALLGVVMYMHRRRKRAAKLAALNLTSSGQRGERQNCGEDLSDSTRS
jgi:hypothetical protein